MIWVAEIEAITKKSWSLSSPETMITWGRWEDDEYREKEHPTDSEEEKGLIEQSIFFEKLPSEADKWKVFVETWLDQN